MVNDQMSVVTGQSVVVRKLIGHNPRTGHYAVFDNLVHDFFLAPTTKDGGLDVPATFQHSHDYGLSASALHSAITAQTLALCAMHVPRLSADESFIHFDFTVGAAAQFAAALLVLQREPEAMKHEPRRLLSYAQSTMDFHTAHSVFAVAEHPVSDHPFVHTEWGILEDRPYFDGELFLALIAEPDAPRLNERVPCLVATRASDLAFRPAKFHGVVETALRIGEINNGLL